jgi:hypothetical protein
MEKFKTEEQLGDAFISVLKKFEYEIWCEVESITGIIDIVTYKDDIYETYHLKLQMSNKVIEQAMKCHIFNTRNYIVVPAPKRGTNIDAVQDIVINKYNLGVIQIPIYIWERLEEDNSQLFSYIHKKRYVSKEIPVGKFDISKILYDSQKTDKAGIKGGGYDTAFKRSMNLLINYYKENEYTSLENTWNIFKDQLHWSSKYSFYNAMSKLSHLDIVHEARKLMMDK